MDQRGKVVIVCGLIGSGKSTLSHELAQALGPQTIWLQEPDEKGGKNPYLARYYQDPKRWALTMQLHLLGMRYEMHLRAQWYTMQTGHCAVMDSSYYQDTAFAHLQLAQGCMDEDEFATYRKLYHAMTASVLLPTVCVRVLVSPEVCLERVKKRMEKQTGRTCEVAIKLAYMVSLDREIDKMVCALRRMGVDTIDMPWDVDRDTEEQRALAVRSLAARVQAIEPVNQLLDHHRRAI